MQFDTCTMCGGEYAISLLYYNQHQDKNYCLHCVRNMLCEITDQLLKLEDL